MMWGMIFAAFVFMLYMYVWSLPKKRALVQQRPVIDHRYYVREIRGGGLFVFAEVPSE